MLHKTLTHALTGMALVSLTVCAHAQKKYDTGASDTEIKVGNIVPYSGPASSYGAIGKAMTVYFEKINKEGGVNGRKIKFISLDDGYNPAKTVEQTRKLVEQEGVLLLLSPLGSAQNSAIQKYVQQKKIPHLFVASGAAKWSDPKNSPWSIGWNPSYPVEASIYAKHILETKPNAKIAVLYQNDDFGKDYLKGFRSGLGNKVKDMIVSEASYEVTDPTMDNQIVSLKASGADTLVYFTSPKFSAQAIKKTGDIGWKPTQYLANVSIQIDSVIKPAGTDYAKGIYSVAYLKDTSDPQWQKTKEYNDWATWMKEYNPSADMAENHNVYGYSQAQLLVHVLKKAGDNLTRENIMKQAANLDTTLPMLLPGIKLKTTPDDYALIKRLQLIQFNGTVWNLTDKTYGQ
ncbi:branched-chain amino acid ABC transporter substrate-binding protein [Noviherbaspirillum sedimenti]|uniref:Branched-chain amino acid ABC transporter substrate-binding protein n=2 Tax=Noviherbaspirillum sedimenti TaxID=2320865 RepID=A0A3A3G966_9BURK|nr:branched-chain amino acid ABC transporter substrate-binding protein [Noviherbaspirillum sedimenti]